MSFLMVSNIPEGWTAEQLPPIEPLRWTKELPTKPGHYWHRVGEFGPTVVFVTTDHRIVYLGGNGQYNLHETGEWAGPIPEPCS